MQLDPALIARRRRIRCIVFSERDGGIENVSVPSFGSKERAETASPRSIDVPRDNRRDTRTYEILTRYFMLM